MRTRTAFRRTPKAFRSLRDSIVILALVAIGMTVQIDVDAPSSAIGANAATSRVGTDTTTAEPAAAPELFRIEQRTESTSKAIRPDHDCAAAPAEPVPHAHPVPHRQVSGDEPIVVPAVRVFLSTWS